MTRDEKAHALREAEHMRVGPLARKVALGALLDKVECGGPELLPECKGDDWRTCPACSSVPQRPGIEALTVRKATRPKE